MSGAGGSLLVVDVGTSGVRAAIVRPDAAVECVHHAEVLPSTPAPGMVEIDAQGIAAAVIELSLAALNEGGPVAGVGIANQRATTVVWNRRTGRPVAPGIGWQDLRTVGTCLALQADGIRLAPNMSAPKLAAILDDVDPERTAGADLCFGTIDAWVAWTLSGGALHITDTTNAGVTGLVEPHSLEWDDEILRVLRIPRSMLPTIVDSSGVVGEASVLPGAPPIAGICGDQQASLVGQGCTRPGRAKVTFGTGGMLDLCTGWEAPATAGRKSSGTFSIVAWSRAGRRAWGVEAVMLSAGTCVEWLRDDLGVLASAEDSASVAAGCANTGDLWFVPALLGIGTPIWDFGARGTLVGITRGTGRADLVRAVLEGVAHRGADLLEAAEADSGMHVEALRMDGGMSANALFVDSVCEAVGRPVEVAPVLEATTLGAGFLAGMAVGTWKDEDDAAEAYSPGRTVEPRGTDSDRLRLRERWAEARSRALGSIPELSGVAF